MSETVTTTRDAIRDVQGSFSYDSTTTPGDEPTAPGPSLLTPKGLRAGKAILRRDVPGRLKTIRIDADRIAVQSVRGGKVRIAQLRRGAEATEVFATTSAPNAGATIAFSELDPAAPSRLIRAGARRLRRSATRVDYVVAYEAPTEGVIWVAYWRDGAYASGDRSGRRTRVYRG